MWLRLCAFAAALAALTTTSAQAAFDLGPKVRASLIAEAPGVTPGGTVTIALREEIIPRWHTYWRNPGDSGEPTRITWELPEGWTVGDIQWPYPKRLPVGPLMNFGYEGEVILPMTVTAPQDARAGTRVTLYGHASWLVCEEVCIPEEADVVLSLDVTAAPPAPDPRYAVLFAEARARLPEVSPWPAHFGATDEEVTLVLVAPELVRARPDKIVFFPYDDGYIVNSAPQSTAYAGDAVRLATKPGRLLRTDERRAKAETLNGIVVVTSQDGATRALEIAAAKDDALAAPPIAARIGFGKAILLAFLGGLILNLMPCVLPVLSIKALALAGKAGAERGAAAMQGASYGVGVLAGFGVLAAALIALRAGGEAVGWGFQLQDPVVVAAFALLMFAVGLNLSGVYEIGGRLAGIGGGLVARGGQAGAFLTGLLAVAVAAPCTAPFMGLAIGFALSQPGTITLAVFLALGAGFALPFVALSLSPAFLRLLPRPGAWMETFRNALAFPMYGAAVWLVWVLSYQAGPDGMLAALAAMALFGFGSWAWQRSRSAGRRWRTAGGVLGAAGLAGALLLLPLADTGAATEQAAGVSEGIPFEPYSAERLATLRGEGRAVFVNATAAWCITCLVNEKVALSSDAVRAAFTERGIAYLKADWTNRNAEIAALLAQHGRSGVPLYLIYAPGAAEAEILPQILTPEIVLGAIRGFNAPGQPRTEGDPKP